MSTDDLLKEAMAHHGAGRLSEAEALYGRILETDPGHPEGLHLLGALSLQRNDAERAVTLIGRALERRPDYAEAHYNLGLALQALGWPEAAVESYGRLIALKPDAAVGHNNLGNALRDLGRSEEALAAFDRALELQPDSADTHYNRGLALGDLGRPEEAAEAYRRALALAPGHVRAWNNLGNALRASGRVEEAMAAYRQAVDADPGYAEAHNNLGNALRDLGRTEEAAAGYRRAIAAKADHAGAYGNLALMKRFSQGDADLAAIEDLLTKPGLSDADRIQLHYAAGKAWADIGGEADRAFRHFAQGARLRHGQSRFDIAGTEASFAAVASRVGPPAAPGAADGPIFIVGMPRSGTTLVEQILASHPGVRACGERSDLPRIVKAAAARIGRPFHAWTDAEVAAEAPGIGADYLASLPDGGGGLRPTDKMPTNFRFAGLIARALPGARIVHVRRSPADTCVSCFTTLFAAGNEFSYDLEELGRFYRAYAALMERFSAILPGAVLMDVAYEDLVAEPEREVRRLLDHCGLEWEPRCLDFHRTERAVQTASAEQVRRPLYASSVGRWEVYRDHLGLLFEALGPLAP